MTEPCPLQAKRACHHLQGPLTRYGSRPTSPMPLCPPAQPTLPYNCPPAQPTLPYNSPLAQPTLPYNCHPAHYPYLVTVPSPSNPILSLSQAHPTLSYHCVPSLSNPILSLSQAQTTLSPCPHHCPKPIQPYRTGPCDEYKNRYFGLTLGVSALQILFYITELSILFCVFLFACWLDLLTYIHVFA